MHQPDYLPWLGYFNKIAVADIFIFFDTADFSGGGFHHRNKIKVDAGWTYLVIPVRHSEFFRPIESVNLPTDNGWAKKHWRSIEVHYRRAPYWSNYADFFKDLFAKVDQFATLADLNIRIIEYLCQQFGLNTPRFRSSQFAFDPKLQSTEAILAIIKQVGATKFLAGPSGKNYLNRERFKEEEIELLFQEYKETTHGQLFPPFIPGLSAVDLLFNEGPKSIDYLR